MPEDPENKFRLTFLFWDGAESAGDCFVPRNDGNENNNSLLPRKPTHEPSVATMLESITNASK